MPNALMPTSILSIPDNSITEAMLVPREYELWLHSSHWTCIDPRSAAPNNPIRNMHDNFQPIDVAGSGATGIATLSMLPVGAILTQIVYWFRMGNAASTYRAYTFQHIDMTVGNPNSVLLDDSTELSGVTGNISHVYTPDPPITMDARHPIQMEVRVEGETLVTNARFTGAQILYTI